MPFLEFFQRKASGFFCNGRENESRKANLNIKRLVSQICRRELIDLASHVVPISDIHLLRRGWWDGILRGCPCRFLGNVLDMLYCRTTS